MIYRFLKVGKRGIGLLEIPENHMSVNIISRYNLNLESGWILIMKYYNIIIYIILQNFQFVLFRPYIYNEFDKRSIYESKEY